MILILIWNIYDYYFLETIDKYTYYTLYHF